ncbi:MAG: hypothetical protein RIC03_12485 [Cyclobacteriaceae bacterium]
MKQLIDNIASIRYAKISTIEYEQIDRIAKTIELDTVWELMLTGNSLMTIQGVQADEGFVFKTDLSSSLKSELLLDEPVILLIELTDNNHLVLGETDLPVIFDEVHLMAGKSISANHDSWHYPYTLIDY